jgi:hypothetical protein
MKREVKSSSIFAANYSLLSLNSPVESNSIPTQSREQAVKKAEKASQWANLEGYAQKLLQGFDKLDEGAALKAPWELMQNACDLTERCIVTVDFQHDKLAFSHNGQPFSTNTLLALIKQKSGEKRAGQELALMDGKLPIGQYGTGFITTHSFGRVIQLDATLLIGEPGTVEAIPLVNFQLDRSTEAKDEAGKLEELTNKLFAQEKEMYRLILETMPLPEPGNTTTFCYKPNSDTERHKIELALASLRLYTPYVMALNDTLHEVTLVEATGEHTHYAKEEWVEQAGYWQVPVAVGGYPTTISCLRAADDSIVVVLPLVDGEVAVEPDPELARLFLYFPLIGTARWGCNFLIHAKQFAPTEPRDGLQLDLTIESSKQKAERNRALLLEASKMIFDFLQDAAERITQPICLARINFGLWPVDEDDAEQHFSRLLQQRWVEQFRELKLVETLAGRQSVAACWFLDPELLRDEAARPAIHAVAAQIWEQQLPTEELVVAWTDVLHEWKDKTVKWIKAENLAEQLAKHGCLDGLEPEALRQTYAYLLAQGKSQLFDDHALLPIESGKFQVKSSVKLPENLEAGHLAALRGIAPEIVVEFIAPDFAELGTDLVLESYGRSKLERDVNDKTKKLREEGNQADQAVLTGLLALNSIFPSELGKGMAASTRRKLLPLIGQFYEQVLPEEIVPTIEGDEIDHERTPFRTLLKVFLGDVERKYNTDEEWAAGALPLLLECLEVLAPVAQVQEDVKAAAIFPNQQEPPKLCKPIGMLVEQEFGPTGGNAEQDATRLKDIYESVTGTDIREKLVHPEFERVLSYFKPEELTGRDLSAKIESQLMEQPLDDITGHSKKAEIFAIVRLLADYPKTEWNKFFPNINEKRANIVLAKVQSPKVKNDLFNIISLEDDQIEMLGNLAKDENFETIVKLGRAAMLASAQQESDFEFKKAIGVMIEDLIRGRIQTEVAGLPVEVLEEQGGQDIVVKLNGRVVYYLEVKSRWQVGYSTTLSHLQSLRAAENPNCYALCCVDLTTYFPTGEAQRHVIKSVEEIESLICFLPDIGSLVDTLTANVRVAERSPAAVKLAEEFRVLVPQEVVQQGVGLSEFIRLLRGQLAKLATTPLSAVEPTPVPVHP